jgi:hypothetical protein
VGVLAALGVGGGGGEYHRSLSFFVSEPAQTCDKQRFNSYF